MKCKILINSSGEGWDDSLQDVGEFIKTEKGCEIHYKIADDECLICIEENTVTQTRRGDTNVDISFRMGKTTQCKISTGGFSGGYAVFTEELSYSLKKGGLRLKITYLNGDDKERINLTFTALFNTQEKL